MHRQVLRNSKGALRAALVAGVVSVIFAAGELLAMSLLGHSSIVMADMIHSILDALMSFATAFSIYIVTTRRRSSRFPWGLYNAESLASMFIAIVTLFYALETLYTGLTSPSKTPHYVAPLLLVGSVVSYSMYRLEAKWAERSMSSSLRSDALHARSDAMLTLSALAGVAIELTSGSLLPQAVVLLLITGYIVRDSLHIFKESVLSILGAMPPRETVEDLVRIAESSSGLRVHRVMLKRMGSFVSGVIMLEAEPTISLGEAHRISRKVRRAIYKERPDVVNLVVVIKPRESIVKIIRNGQQYRGRGQPIASYSYHVIK